MSDDDKPYDVGYGKPPKHSQFQKGQSGNPAGRPKGRRIVDPARVLTKVVNARMLIREGGVERRVSRLEVALRQLANKAAAGDHKSIALLLKSLDHFSLTPKDNGLVSGVDYGVLVVPEKLTPEEWDKRYGPRASDADLPEP